MAAAVNAQPMPEDPDDGEPEALSELVGRSNAEFARNRSRRLSDLLLPFSPDTAWNESVQLDEQNQFLDKQKRVGGLERLHLQHVATLFRVSIAMTWIALLSFATTTVGAVIALLIDPSLGIRLLLLGGAGGVTSGAGAVAARRAGRAIHRGVRHARSVHQPQMRRPSPGPRPEC